MEHNGAGMRGKRTVNTSVLWEKGIGVKTYYYRLKKLHEAAIEAQVPELVQVVVPTVKPLSSGIVIRSDKATIEIPCDAKPETVQGGSIISEVAMIDLSNIKKYYIACGYTDLRRGIDGLAEIV